MANAEHDRADLSALAPGIACESSLVLTPSGAAAIAPALLSLRVSQSDSDVPGTFSPALGLIADLIQASGGTENPGDPRGISACFPTLSLAVLVARRVQWALQGFGMPATITVRLRGEVIGSSTTPGSAQSGQIFLSPRVAEVVPSVPGLTIAEVRVEDNGDGWREFLWQAPPESVSFVDDEEALLGLIRDSGREDPCPLEAGMESLGSTSYEVSGNNDVPELSPTIRNGVRNRFSLLLAGVGIAVAVVVGMIAVAAHRSPAPSRVTSQPVEQTPKPKLSSGSVAPIVIKPGTAVPPRTPASDSRATVGEALKSPPAQIKKPPAVQPQPTNPAALGSCDFTEAGISRALARAETDMHDGNLEEAKTAFLTIRGCASAHDRIEDDLRIVQRKIDAQAFSPPNP